jgi:methanogenic corrinoid protein MtbC1
MLTNLLKRRIKMSDDLKKALADLKEKEALEIAQKLLDSGEDPLKILSEAREAVAVVGQRYQDGTYFIPDLVYSGEILKGIVEMVKPKIAGPAEAKYLGKIVIGTVKGDIHDIGKDIVTFMLDVNGFDVYDLGIDVPAQKFVDKIKEVKPEVVALSGFLTLSYDSMKDTVQAIKNAELRDKVKIMIGGGVLDQSVVDYVEADAFGRFAGDAVTIAKEWIGGN